MSKPPVANPFADFGKPVVKTAVTTAASTPSKTTNPFAINETAKQTSQSAAPIATSTLAKPARESLKAFDFPTKPTESVTATTKVSSNPFDSGVKPQKPPKPATLAANPFLIEKPKPKERSASSENIQTVPNPEVVHVTSEVQKIDMSNSAQSSDGIPFFTAPTSEPAPAPAPAPAPVDNIVVAPVPVPTLVPAPALVPLVPAVPVASEDSLPKVTVPVPPPIPSRMPSLSFDNFSNDDTTSEMPSFDASSFESFKSAPPPPLPPVPPPVESSGFDMFDTNEVSTPSHFENFNESSTVSFDSFHTNSGSLSLNPVASLGPEVPPPVPAVPPPSTPSNFDNFADDEAIPEPISSDGFEMFTKPQSSTSGDSSNPFVTAAPVVPQTAEEPVLTAAVETNESSITINTENEPTSTNVESTSKKSEYFDIPGFPHLEPQSSDDLEMFEPVGLPHLKPQVSDDLEMFEPRGLPHLEPNSSEGFEMFDKHPPAATAGQGFDMFDNKSQPPANHSFEMFGSNNHSNATGHTNGFENFGGNVPMTHSNMNFDNFRHDTHPHPVSAASAPAHDEFEMFQKPSHSMAMAAPQGFDAFEAPQAHSTSGFEHFHTATHTKTHSSGGFEMFDDSHQSIPATQTAHVSGFDHFSHDENIHTKVATAPAHDEFEMFQKPSHSMAMSTADPQGFDAFEAPQASSTHVSSGFEHFAETTHPTPSGFDMFNNSAPTATTTTTNSGFDEFNVHQSTDSDFRQRRDSFEVQSPALQFDNSDTDVFNLPTPATAPASAPVSKPSNNRDPKSNPFLGPIPGFGAEVDNRKPMPMKSTSGFGVSKTSGSSTTSADSDVIKKLQHVYGSNGNLGTMKSGKSNDFNSLSDSEDEMERRPNERPPLKSFSASGLQTGQQLEGKILARESTRSLFTKEWHPMVYVLDDDKLSLYKDSSDIGIRAPKKVINVAYNLRLLKIKPKPYTGYPILHNFMLEEVMDYGPVTVAKFGSGKVEQKRQERNLEFATKGNEM